MADKELGKKLAGIIAAHDKPNINTRTMISDPVMWTEIARAFLDAVDERLAEFLEVSSEDAPTEVSEPVEEEVEKPARKTSRRGKR